MVTLEPLRYFEFCSVENYGSWNFKDSPILIWATFFSYQIRKTDSKKLTFKADIS